MFLGTLAEELLYNPKTGVTGEEGIKVYIQTASGCLIPNLHSSVFFTWLDFLAPFADAATSQLLEHKGGERDYQHRKPGEVVEDKVGDFQREVWLAF